MSFLRWLQKRPPIADGSVGSLALMASLDTDLQDWETKEEFAHYFRKELSPPIAAQVLRSLDVAWREYQKSIT